MSIFSPGTIRQYDLGITILRVITGIIFTAHGAQKLFVFGFAGVSGAFVQMGAPLPGITGPLVGLLEFFGLALIVGLLTRLVALGLAIDMLGAILIVHIHNGFFAPNGVEFVLALLTAAATLALTGAGSLSLDAAIDRRRSSGAASTVRPRTA
jgi:putative oxidoreductase